VANEALDIMRRTDYLDRTGEVLVHQAWVLRESGKADDALAAAREALTLFNRKGATLLVERTQRLIDDWTGTTTG
jgi:hypothetical protein